ncbi:IclR family transcriptional regulator [Streptomyces sp. NBC_00006]|uniref:IclR family transcriptional regulator n=1 Tax=unclassified Streptomyces TaxID=2593676 RepID=UPI00224F053A|nr:MULTISPECIES: IclR family transcriptional regulator [unclassified Streptomyces]MCX4831431.1 IclR family transcriptional regulator [Streptomyces sp. NBC_01016]MCX5535955.1 IclR family transcriptional regulator [Streptomyces sp. NBC_00006]
MGSTDSTGPGQAAEATGVRSVRRALDILGLLTEDQPAVTLREIVDATGLAKTTAVRMVQTLEQCGLLWDTPAGYTAGPGLWRWAHLAHTSWELPRETRKLMRELAEEQQETVNLFMLRGLSRVCVAQQESPQPLRHVVRVGDELPLWAGASSKILLRSAPESLLRRVAVDSPHGEGHARQLRVWADVAVEQGFAVSRGERDEGLTAVAVPVLGRTGTVVASLSLSGPSHRFPEATVQRFATALVEVARQMSEQGFDHPLSPVGPAGGRK